MSAYDVIVLGTGGVGSAALYHLAARGARVLGLDRFPPAHDRGSSHGRTRMIRQAYFEHPDYVPLVLRAYALWESLEREAGRRLYHETGLIEVGPPAGVVIPGVLSAAAKHGLAIDRLSREEIERRWPGMCVPEPLTGLFERRAGFLLVEDCVRTHLELAVARGATLRTDRAVTRWNVEGQRVVVETEDARYWAANLVVTAGAWSAELLRGLEIPLVVRRKPMYWFGTSDPSYHESSGFPAFFFELPHGQFYGFPQFDADGLKVAEHTGGAVVADPLGVNRELDAADLERVQGFLRDHLPAVEPAMKQHSVCMYTMTPDEHFLIDRLPEHDQVALVAGLSGHGFKFAPVLGEILAELTLDGSTRHAVEFLSCRRASLRAR